MAKLDFCRWKFLRQRISRLPLGLDVGFRTNSLLLDFPSVDSLFCLVCFFHILVFLVLKVCVSAELAPLPSLQEPAVPLPLSISCSERGPPTLWGPEHSNKVFKTLFEWHHRQFLAQRESAPNIMGTRGFKQSLEPSVSCSKRGLPTVWVWVDQSDIWIPKCTEGGGTGLGKFPKFYQFFCSLKNIFL